MKPEPALTWTYWGRGTCDDCDAADEALYEAHLEGVRAVRAPRCCPTCRNRRGGVVVSRQKNGTTRR